MDCREVRDHALAGSPLPEAALAHAAACPACAELVATGASLAAGLGSPVAAPPPDLDALLARVEGRVAAERGVLAWLRSRPTWLRRLLIVASALPLLAYLLASSGLRVDWAYHPAFRIVGVLGSLGALGLWLLLAGTRPVQVAQPPSSRIGLLVALGALAAFAIAGLPPPHSVDTSPADPVTAGIECYVWGLLLGLPVIVVALCLRRQVTLGGTLLVAAAAGLISNFELHLDCCATERVHLLASHATVATTFVGIVLLRELVRR